MKRNIALSLTALFMFFPSLSLAKPFILNKKGIRIQSIDRVGNGGNTVVCESGEPFSIDLLDYFEARFFDRSFALDLGSPSWSYSRKTQEVLTRITGKAPIMGARLQKWYDEFIDEALFAKDVSLEEIDDSAHVVVPDGCKVMQTVVQFSDDDRINGIRYLVDLDIWNDLNEDQKAGLILHELIYRHALELGHKNSSKARRLTSLVSSVKMQRLNDQQFQEEVDKLRFGSTELDEFPDLYLTDLHYDRDGKVRGGTVYLPSKLEFPGLKLNLEIGTRFSLGYSSIYIFKDSGGMVSQPFVYKSLAGDIKFNSIEQIKRLEIDPKGLLKEVKYVNEDQVYPCEFDSERYGEFLIDCKSMRDWMNSISMTPINSVSIEIPESSEPVVFSGRVSFRLRDGEPHVKEVRGLEPFTLDLARGPTRLTEILEYDRFGNFEESLTYEPLLMERLREDLGQSIWVDGGLDFTDGYISEGHISKDREQQLVIGNNAISLPGGSDFDYHSNSNTGIKSLGFQSLDDLNFKIDGGDFTCRYNDHYQYMLLYHADQRGWVPDTCYLRKGSVIKIGDQLIEVKKTHMDDIQEAQLSFENNGQLSWVWVQDTFPFNLQNVDLILSSITLSEDNGRVSGIIPERSAELKKVDGSIVVLIPGKSYQVNPDGLIK